MKEVCVFHASVAIMIAENKESALDFFKKNCLFKERALWRKKKSCYVVSSGNFSMKPGLALNEKQVKIINKRLPDNCR